MAAQRDAFCAFLARKLTDEKDWYWPVPVPAERREIERGVCRLVSSLYPAIKRSFLFISAKVVRQDRMRSTERRYRISPDRIVFFLQVRSRHLAVTFRKNKTLTVFSAKSHATVR